MFDLSPGLLSNTMSLLFQVVGKLLTAHIQAYLCLNQGVELRNKLLVPCAMLHGLIKVPLNCN